MSRRPARRPAGVVLPAFIALLSAAALLTYNHMGGDAQVSALLDALAASKPFVASSFALEAGFSPDEDAFHNPSPAAASPPQADAPEAETAAESALPAQEAAPAAEIPAQDKRDTDIEIRNDAERTVDAAAMLDDPYEIKVSGEGPQVLIYHTHSTEAYTPSGSDQYKASGSYRTRDQNQSVIRVGTELKKVLEARGIETVHITDIFDDPAYNGSYGRSLTAAQAMLEKYPGIKVTIDLHRDAILTDDGRQYRLATTIGGQEMAQMMLVIGTDTSGLTHPHWQDNMNFAVNLQADINGAYPGLMRPVNLRQQRFNTHLRRGSILLEVGSSGNTLQEAITAARLFGEKLADRISPA